MSDPRISGSAPPIQPVQPIRVQRPDADVDTPTVDAPAVPDAPEVPNQIEPDAPSAEAINEAMEDVRGLQKGATFDPDTVDLMPDTNPLEEAKDTAKKAAGGVLGEVKQELAALETHMNEAEKMVNEFASTAEMLSQDFAREQLGKVFNMTQQGRNQIEQLESQLNDLRQNMGRLGEEKLNKLLGPLEEQLNAMNQKLQELDDAIPGKFKADYENMQLQYQLRGAAGEINAQLSRNEASISGEVSTDTFKAMIEASTQTGVSGTAQVEHGAFRAVIEASAQQVEGSVNVNTDRLQALVELTDGNLSAEAQVSLDHLKAQISADGSGVDGQLEVDTTHLNAVLRAADGQLSGEAALDLELLKVNLSADSGGLSGQVAVDTAAVKLLVSATDGKVNAAMQLEVDKLKAQLQAGPDGASGSVELNTDTFNMLLEASSSGNASARVEVNTEHFNAALTAATDGSVSGRVSVSNDNLKVMAEVVYKKTLAVQLGVETDQIRLTAGTDGNSFNWSVVGQGGPIGGGFSGTESTMSGVMRVGEVGIEIGWHDTTIDAPDHVRERMEMMGGEPVESSMYGVMVSFPF